PGIFEGTISRDISRTLIRINRKQVVIAASRGSGSYTGKETILEEKELVGGPIGSICPATMTPAFTTPVWHVDARWLPATPIACCRRIGKSGVNALNVVDQAKDVTKRHCYAGDFDFAMIDPHVGAHTRYNCAPTALKLEDANAIRLRYHCIISRDSELESGQPKRGIAT